MLSSAEPASTAVVKAESSSGVIVKACSGAGNVCAAHLVRVGLYAVAHRIADVGEALHELGLERVGAVHVEQVVEDEHLAVGAGARADADRGDREPLRDRRRDGLGDAFQDDAEAPGRLERERVVVEPLGVVPLRPWALWPPSMVAVCGVSPMWPITGMPAATIAAARVTDVPEPSSFTQSAPASFTNRPAFRTASSSDTW